MFLFANLFTNYHNMSIEKPAVSSPRLLDELWEYQFSSVQLLSCVQLFVTSWTAAHQPSLSITNSWSLLKIMSIKSGI